MTATWQERKRAELDAKLAGIRSELDAWRKSSRDDPRVQKNHSQIEAITDRLAELLRLTEEAPEQQHLPVSWQVVEEQVLDLHRVWGFFRGQLLLRRSADHADFLVLADEFTWACYKPAQLAAITAGRVNPAAVRQPPLVFLAATASPVAIPRGSSYTAEVGGLSTAASRAVARELPVPVVTVPWFAPQHVPEIMVLGHEIGHHVEDDFGLTATIDRLVATVAPCDARWARWAGEVFADVYGTLCGGSAYAAVLGDFVHVAGVPGSGSGSYPPAPLRLAVVRETLRLAVSDEAAADVAGRWSAAGIGPTEDATARAVATALVEGPYPRLGVKRLDEMTGLEANAVAVVTTCRKLLRPQQLTTTDVRTLVAGAALAFATNPAGYVARAVAQQVFERVRSIQEPGTRYRAAAGTPVSEAAHRAHASDTATTLYALLRGHGEPRPGQGIVDPAG